MTKKIELFLLNGRLPDKLKGLVDGKGILYLAPAIPIIPWVNSLSS